MGMSSGLQVFGHKQKYTTNKNCDLQMVLEEKSEAALHPRSVAVGTLSIHFSNQKHQSHRSATAKSGMES